MPSLAWTALAAAIAMGAQPVPLSTPRPVLPGIAALPRIADPRDEAEQRVNRALDRLDAKVRAAARDCLRGGTRPGYWGRRVDAPMRGPEFLSYLVTDEVDCGGAHPNAGHGAIVYDLRSGLPVNWTALLPPALTGKLALTEWGDGVRVVTLASPRLFALYRARYRPDKVDADAKECRDVIAQEGDNGPVPMLAWLDAKEGGVALQFDLPHVAQACSDAVVIPAATLRGEGASPRLLAALAAAHARATAARNLR